MRSSILFDYIDPVRMYIGGQWLLGTFDAGFIAFGEYCTQQVQVGWQEPNRIGLLNIEPIICGGQDVTALIEPAVLRVYREKVHRRIYPSGRSVLSANLQYVRIMQGLTLQEAAQRLKISVEFLELWESGRYDMSRMAAEEAACWADPDRSLLSRMSRLYDVSADELWSRELFFLRAGRFKLQQIW